MTSRLMFCPMARHRMRLRLSSPTALAIVSPSAEGSIMPNSLLGTSSCTPPTFVTRGVAPHAAASSKEVEKPSEREGRQKTSESLSRAETSGESKRPKNVALGSGVRVNLSFKGPSPAMRKWTDSSSVKMLAASMRAGIPFSGINQPLKAMTSFSSDRPSSRLKERWEALSAKA